MTTEATQVPLPVLPCRFRSVTNLTKCEEPECREMDCEGCPELIDV